MSRPTWPPKYANVPIPTILDSGISNAAFRFFCKLRALSWGDGRLCLPMKTITDETGLSRTRVYEYARSLRDHRGLLSYDVRNDVFECSFPDVPESESRNPGLRDLPNQVLNPPVVKNHTEEHKAKSRKTGLEIKPPAVEVFRTAAKCWPSKAQWPAMATAVGEDPARLELWGRVVGGYILKGWNPRNVAGMLEFFNRGEVPGANGHQTTAIKPGFRLPDGV